MAGVTAEAPPRRVPRYQLDTTLGRLTPEASAAKGKAARTDERDYQALKDAAAAGRITAEQGL
jgi:hypothetical protein